MYYPNLKVLGLRKEIYIGTEISGFNMDFEYKDVEKTKYIFNCVDASYDKYEVTIWEEDGMCGSGYTTASWGNIAIKEVKNFSGFQYKPKKEIVFDLDTEAENIFNDAFNVSLYGDDHYYPRGFVNAVMQNFKENNRVKTQRPVWIFSGKSGLGKSFLAHKIEGLKVYETDSYPDLPESIKEDIIVIGNKYEFNIEDIKKLAVGNPEFIEVNFT